MPAYPGVLNAVDMSRWSGPFNMDEALDMKAMGIKYVMVATGPGNYSLYTRQQAETTIAAGLGLMAYTFLEFVGSPEAWVQDSVADVAGLPVILFSLDIEDNANGTNWSIEQRINHGLRASSEMERLGFPPALAPVYTGGWFWPRMGNTPAFKNRGHMLHRAYYDGEPDIDDTADFGGWTEADIVIEQFQGTTILAGQSVDLNYVVESRLPNLKGEPDMNEEETRKIARDEAAKLLDGLGIASNLVPYLNARLELAEGAFDKDIPIARLHAAIAALRG